MTVYILLHRGHAGSGALAEKRTAPVGFVGWRFHHDSLGSHACLHLYGPQKTQELQQQRTRQGLTTPKTITWVCGDAKFTLKQVQKEEEE